MSRCARLGTSPDPCQGTEEEQEAEVELVVVVEEEEDVEEVGPRWMSVECLVCVKSLRTNRCPRYSVYLLY